MKLYRKLGVFSVSLALIDHSFAVLGMPHALSGTESRLAMRLGRRSLRQGKLLAARSKKLGDIVDRVVRRSTVGGTTLRLGLPISRALVFVLIGIVGRARGFRRQTRRGPSGRAQVLQQLPRN